MRKITEIDLRDILKKHELWLKGEEGGEKADLRGSDLSYSNLRGSDLRGSDLSYSNLRGSNLRNSNLRNSNLSYSDLRGSDLSYSDLRGSNLRGTIGFVYIGQRSDGYQFHAVYDAEKKQWFIRSGCRYMTIPEYRLHTLSYYEEIKRQETLDLLDFAEKRINLLGKIK
jgi:uncharacterized protein YjbI with pentapeptide repeats